MRAGYWYGNLHKALNCEVTVLTGQQDAAGENIHVIQKEGTSWMTKFIADDGVIWKNNIKEYLKKNPVSEPDLVIITGGPFMHFSLTNWFKAKYTCKVILDYRDPFATNPGFDNGWLKTKIKRSFESRFNRAADGLITVNTYCGKIIEHFDDKPNAIVQNGYNEQVVSNPSDVKLGKDVSFCYAGKFYFHPAQLEQALISSHSTITYIGPDEDQLDVSSDYVNSRGFVDYPTALEAIGTADVGIIQTYGHEFQSTTKIFDYLRCERAILIISDDKLEEGSIHDELEGYPNVFWAKNDAVSIISAIDKIKESTYTTPPSGFADKYSRGYQLQHLITLIEKLTR